MILQRKLIQKAADGALEGVRLIHIAEVRCIFE